MSDKLRFNQEVIDKHLSEDVDDGIVSGLILPYTKDEFVTRGANYYMNRAALPIEEAYQLAEINYEKWEGDSAYADCTPEQMALDDMMAWDDD